MKADTFKDFRDLNTGYKDPSKVLMSHSEINMLSDASKYLKNNVM